jgi:signal transduction histidine kinase
VVTVTSDEHHAEAEIADDGHGGANPEHGSGPRGLVDRLDALRGHLHTKLVRVHGSDVDAAAVVAAIDEAGYDAVAA